MLWLFTCVVHFMPFSVFFHCLSLSTIFSWLASLLFFFFLASLIRNHMTCRLTHWTYSLTRHELHVGSDISQRLLPPLTDWLLLPWFHLHNLTSSGEAQSCDPVLSAGIVSSESARTTFDVLCKNIFGYQNITLQLRLLVSEMHKTHRIAFSCKN